MSAASSWDDVVASRDMRLVAKHYRDCRLAPIPLHPRSKRPIHDDWLNLVADDLTPFPGNIGVKCGEPSGGLTDLDLDCREAMLLAPAVMPPTAACFGRLNAPCSHWLYTCDPTPEATRQWINDNKEMILEVRSSGGQTMFPPSVHPTGEVVSWHRQGQAALVEGAELHRSAGILAACSLLMRHWPKPEARTRYHAWGAMIGSLLRCGVDVETVQRVVGVFVKEFSPGRATKSRLRAAAALRARLDSGKGRVPGFPSLKGVFGEAVERLCREWLPRAEEEVNHGLSEQGLALQFVAEQREALSFTPAWDRWHIWDGAVWRRDDKLFAFSAASRLCRRIGKTLARRDEARRLGAAHTRAAVVNLAREHLVVTVDEWNANPWLLGTPGGIWDLRTGELRQGCRDYINRAVRAEPMLPDYRCPLWLNALDEIFQKDTALIAYMRRLAGYCLTGSVREEVLNFFYGEGGNGKGTFIETVLYCMGDYGVTIPMTTLVETRHPEHPTEIAKLCGARLAVASETKEGNYWDTGRIKALTGGDRLTGRFMRQDYFDFDPTHKLVVTSNLRPNLAQVDDALRRRVQEVPFKHKFDKPDLNLKAGLREEAAGILGWMVEGCLEWQKQGLNPPAAVVEASQQNLETSDDLSQWIDDCCVRHLTAETVGVRLYASWVRWCEGRDRPAGGKRRFIDRMREKWKHHEPRERGVYFLGLRIGDERDP